MADWIGQTIAGWPGPLMLLAIILAAALWIIWQMAGATSANHPKYEWPEDKKKRLQKAAKKAKKG